LAGLHDLVDPSDYTGGLSADGGGIEAKDGWDSSGTTISWLIINHGTHVEYNYTFTVPDKETSHIIFEVSENFTLDDFLSGPTGELKWYEEGSSNPNMPAGFWGIKFEITSNENLTETISFNSTRLAMWGNYYAADGKSKDDVWAEGWNTGLNTAYVGDDAGAFIPVPDTVVPVPGAVLLGMLGLGVAGIKLRKFA
jgi:hypothetical protein